MADFNVYPALDAKTPEFDASSPLAAAQRYLASQTAQAQAEQNLQTSGLAAADTHAQAQETLKSTGLEQALTQQRVTAGANAAKIQDIQTQDELIRHAAERADSPEAWDAAMQDAAANGAKGASQYIGRYSPILRDRVLDTYGATTAQPEGAATSGLAAARGGGAAAAAPDTATLDRQFQGKSPDQIKQTLAKYNLINDALTSVHDEASWESAVQGLVKAGIPEAQQFAGQYNPLQVVQLYNRIQPIRQYLQGRVMQSGAGAPEPLVPKQIKEAGGGLYAVDEFNGGSADELVAPPGKKQYAGVNDAGNPVSFDTRTGAFRADTSTTINAKPSTAALAWQMKYRAALALHPENPDLAMAVANGQRSLSPSEARAAATRMAQKDAEDQAFQGTPPKDYTGYVKQKTDEYYSQIMGAGAPAASPPAGGPGGGPPPPPPPASNAPPANLLKKGYVQQFANGQAWTLGADGKPQRLK